jgi:CRP/FNR family transcriptional regulator, cyclic AMP receptor protein
VRRATVGKVAPRTSREGIGSALPKADWNALLAHGHRRRYPRAARIFCQGDPSNFVIAILEGRVKIAVTSTTGDESLLGIRGPGELVGELAAPDPPPWPSNR